MSTATLRSAPAAASPFPNDTKRLQHINSIRNATVGAQMKRVIDILFQTRQAFTPEQINEACYVDVNGNRDVLEGLRKNPKVNFDGKRFSYKAKHDVKNKDELLVLIREYIQGIAVIDLKDTYPNAMEDLKALKSADHIWHLSDFDFNDETVFPNEPRVNMEVDDDIKRLLRSIELPRDMLNIEKDLQKIGMKPATNTAKRRAAAQVQGISFKPKPRQQKKAYCT
ncbi:general transcription factor IIE subunit 2-like [Hibiscus syriacus]|uniref:general transcription factor IIE subunit 2-like n=1 Tax=Hibiscus syriacus TaxID=106335 RepID=UPI001922A0B0|nr:general transcription factor IIE subunit 2-like [Hibiscus syriacus]